MLPCQYGSQVLICDSFPLDRLNLIGVRLSFLRPVPSPVSILQAELVREFLFYWFRSAGIVKVNAIRLSYCSGRGNYNNAFCPAQRKILISERSVID